MPDIAGLRREMESRTGRSTRHTTRVITAKMDSALLPRDLATMAVAKEWGVPLGRFTNQADLAALRSAQAGTSAPVFAAPQLAAPASPRPSRVSSPRAAAKPRSKRGRTVMVVYGRDDAAKKAMFDFLESLDLKPMSWTQGIHEAKLPNPTVRQIVDALFAKAVAVVVLLTPDDEVRLKDKFHKKNEPAHETQLTGQARPNVLFEAGMAMSSHPDNTVLTQLGDVKGFTDIGGIHITHLNDSIETRRELAMKLDNADCQIDMTNDKWRTAGVFEPEEEGTNG